MNYLPLDIQFDTMPYSKDNFLKALEIIGRNDPLNVKYFCLKYVNLQNPTENNYRNRGILNVRKQINRNLGKNGKVKNRMVRKTANVVNYNLGVDIYLRATIPYKVYFEIIKATYDLLNLCGTNHIVDLNKLESIDNYPAQKAFNDSSLKTVAPIQTAIILGANCKNENKEEILKQLKNKIS